MSVWLWLAVGTGVLVVAGLLVALWLQLSGRKEEARALAGFVPDFVRLSLRLVRDRRVPRRHKLLLTVLVAYLAMPLDLLPGSPLEDAFFALIVLRIVLRGNASLVEEHWPGPPASLALVLRLTAPVSPPRRRGRPARWP